MHSWQICFALVRKCTTDAINENLLLHPNMSEAETRFKLKSIIGALANKI